jgi:hypothetical protein
MPRNRVQHVRRGHEQHLRQVVFHVQIVVHEHIILLRVQHFQQRADGSPRKSMDILSTSSSMKTGFLVPAFFIIWMICPGSAPM